MLTADNWKHRSEGMRCATCIYFVPKDVAGTPTTLGRCRRHAPTMAGFPAVFCSDWCGDHKLSEATVDLAPGSEPDPDARRQR